MTGQWSTDYQRIEQAIGWLDAHASEQPDLATIAAALHLSPGHLQRTFTRFAGTSPKRLLGWLTADAARRLLRERRGVLETTEAVGLSSPGRLHDLMVTVDAVTPGTHAARGEGLEIAVGVHPTPLGAMVVGLTDRGVCALRFLDVEVTDPEVSDGELPDGEATIGEVTNGEVMDAEAGAAARRSIAQDWPRARLVADPPATGVVAKEFVAALARAPGGNGDAAGGGATSQPVPVLLRGTNLQLRVWEALLRLPEDRVTSYGELARAAGRPDAVRAVASAVGRNPVGVLVPCHRVLRSTGALGGYRWGEHRKRALLAREAARADERLGT
jgi:AraC family transcriptional regulator, regulatory protein of adaptative response / methylated-DNA-[protein]-cysteine methyltransferase